MMRKRVFILITISLFASFGAGCIASPASTPALLPIPSALPFNTSAPTGSALPSPTEVVLTPPPTTNVAPSQMPAKPSAPPSSTQAGSAAFCQDVLAGALIDSFKTAVQTSNGVLVASLVSPDHGLEVRHYRDGRVVVYDQEHAKFLFDSSFQVDWGPAPASGQETMGSFHEVILPGLRNLFSKNYTLKCDQIQVGGTTYQALWPYPGINYYSAFFPGTQGSGSLDWLTWLFGIEEVNGKPYLYALMHFEWEP